MKAHFLLFACLLLFACSGNPETDEVEKKEEGVTTIDVVNAKNYDGTLDPLIEDIYFLELEASEDALFTQVSKVLFVEEKMFILDIMSEKVLAFDNDGKFLFTVSKKGLGPGEYQGVSSIAYDYDKNQLILAASGKLLWFDAFGKFIREEKSDIRNYIGDMAYVGNSQFAVYMDMSGNFGEEAVRAIVIDDKAKRVASYQPFSTDTRKENTTAMNSHFSSSQEPLAVGTYSRSMEVQLKRSRNCLSFRFWRRRDAR
jgi:hypothetical protein